MNVLSFLLILVAVVASCCANSMTSDGIDNSAEVVSENRTGCDNVATITENDDASISEKSPVKIIFNPVKVDKTIRLELLSPNAKFTDSDFITAFDFAQRECYLFQEIDFKNVNLEDRAGPILRGIINKTKEYRRELFQKYPNALSFFSKRILEFFKTVATIAYNESYSEENFKAFKVIVKNRFKDLPSKEEINECESNDFFLNLTIAIKRFSMFNDCKDDCYKNCILDKEPFEAQKLKQFAKFIMYPKQVEDVYNFPVWREDVNFENTTPEEYLDNKLNEKFMEFCSKDKKKEGNQILSDDFKIRNIDWELIYSTVICQWERYIPDEILTILKLDESNQAMKKFMDYIKNPTGNDLEMFLRDIDELWNTFISDLCNSTSNKEDGKDELSIKFLRFSYDDNFANDMLRYCHCRIESLTVDIEDCKNKGK